MANCIQCGRKLPGFSFGRKLCSWCVQHEAAKRGEEPEDAVQRVEAPPWLRRESSSMMVTQVIFGINVAVFLGMLFAGVSIMDSPTGQDLVSWGANFGPYTISGQWWRLLTCVFVHGSFLHLAFNMWSLWNIGSLAESVYGHETFAAIYLITGIAASITSIVWNPGVLSVGASGAIFGIVGALLASYYFGGISLPRSQGIIVSLVVFSAYSLIRGFAQTGIDNGAHLGGLVSGLALGTVLAKVSPGHDSPVRRFAALAIVFTVLGGSLGWWLYSHDYQRHLRRGEGFLREGRTDQAIAELQIVIKKRPGLTVAYFDLGRAFATKGDFASAELAYRRVIQLNPRSESGFNNLGYVLLEVKNFDEARRTFRQLLALDGQNASAHFGLGSVAAAEGNYQAAIDEYKLAAQLEPDMDGVYFRMGQAQAHLKQYDEALYSLLRERKRLGDDYDVENALAEVYEAKGMKQEAAEARRKAAEMSGQE